MRYADTDDFGLTLQVDLTGEQLIRAELVLDMASAAVRAAAKSLDASIDAVSETVALDADGTTRLLLPSWPVTAVSTVVVAGVTLPATEYEWFRWGLLRRVSWGWPAGLLAVTVTFTHGYAALPATVADALKSVTLAVAARMWTNPSGLQRMQIGSYSEQYATSGGPTQAERVSGGLTESERATVAQVLA